jgi:UDP-3-O-[3-hydroxymyristoyl] glucosamine N-acyltransferase
MFVDDPRIAFIKIVNYIQKEDKVSAISQYAAISKNTKVGSSCQIGTFTLIGDNCIIEDNNIIYDKAGSGTTRSGKLYCMFRNDNRSR